MPTQRKEGGGGSAGNRRFNFRTDAAISNSRFNERTLTPWVPDPDSTFDGGLEKSSNSNAGWDQFAENERLFGLKTDYDENMYTTVIDKNHPQYRQRAMDAEKKAKEIERSVASTSHVAEERVVDYVTNKDSKEEDEEDKYSGVRRQNLSPLNSSQENKYTPPAKRAPTGQSTVKGAPVDPAIISSQLRAAPKQQAAGQVIEQAPDTASSVSQTNGGSRGKPAQDKVEGKRPVVTEPTPTSPDVPAAPTAPKTSATGDQAGAATPSAAAGRTTSPTGNDGQAPPSATDTVERDVLNSFKNFASQQRMLAEKTNRSRAKADKEVRLTELKRFATTFKLSTPVPTDLVSIIAKDPVKQKEIQAKAIKNAEEVAKAKVDGSTSPTTTTKDGAPTGESATAAATNGQTGRANIPIQPQSQGNRHQGPRQPPFNQGQFPQQPYRNNRGGPNQISAQQTGTLAQRLRNVEANKYAASHQPGSNSDTRAPPTGPANSSDANANRRYSALPAASSSGRLNPNSHEFKPSPFAATFNPSGQVSSASSPRSAVNNVSETSGAPTPAAGSIIRRKTKAVDINKCNILAHIKTLQPPEGRSYSENAGLRPAYDTLPTWRQLKDDEKADSTMHLTVKEYFEKRQPFSGPSLSTPNLGHVAPHLAHQHQLPFHLQQGAPALGSRQSPHMGTMRMDQPHGGMPHPPFGNDDHNRMMPSTSQQSYVSPRPGPAPVAYPGMNSPAQMPYNQPVYMGPGNPQMGQYRSFSNNGQFMPPQQGQMGAPMLMQPHFMQGHQGMVPGPQMMYPGQHHPQFIPPSGPHQPMPGVNGYHSPGRPAAPMMAHQGSQQGQPIYGMSPNVQYNQPAFGPGQPGGPMPNTRGYNGPGPQHYGSSPQQPHGFNQQRNGSQGYNGNKNFTPQGSQQGSQSNPTPPATAPNGPARADSGEDGK